MLGKSLMGDRVFVYEVAGLKQSNENDGNKYPFRSSSNVFIQVPYNRMNQEMLRIARMGGTIVNIRPLDAAASNNSDDSSSDSSD
jgi:phycocyanin-associated rod protein